MITGHGVQKFPTGRLLKSLSSGVGLGYSRSVDHTPPAICRHSFPSILRLPCLRGPATVTRQADTIYLRTAATRGTIWLCPAGLREDFITVSRDIGEVLLDGPEEGQAQKQGLDCLKTVAVAIICKTPMQGSSKTRLSPPLSPDECAAISACFIRDLSETIQNSDP